MSAPPFVRYEIVSAAFAVAGFVAFMTGHWVWGIFSMAAAVRWKVAAASRHPSPAADTARG